MSFTERVFTADLESPFQGIHWEHCDVVIRDASGGVVYDKPNLQFPDFWTQQSREVTASKYFAKSQDYEETSLMRLIERVVRKIGHEGVQHGYFTNVNEALDFQAELSYLIVHQYVTFNSPVWFSIGLPDRPQRASACYIVEVEDSLEGILEWYKTEGLIFKGGSGSGANISTLRSKGESLSKGGSSSGPMSFIRAADASAGAIKSGGTTRRSARMMIMNDNHPDILDFIRSKAQEESKAQALIAQGFDGSFEGEVYSSLAYQNANHSVRVSDKFMHAVEQDLKWRTYEVVSKKVRDEFSARDLLREIAQATWVSGDPGIQFDDTIHTYHTCPVDGRQTGSNPCQPATAPVLTPEGIRTFADIERGSIIWSGERWTRVTRKVSTGIKPVYRYYTRAGFFEATKDHRVVQSGEKIPIGKAESIDVSCGPEPLNFLDLDVQTVVDGLMLGDGSMIYSNSGKNLYPILNIGKKDQEYFTSECSDYITPTAFDDFRHRAKTTLTAEELPKTYERVIPDRFFRGTTKTVCSFLRGLYSANGTVLKAGRIILKAASFQVVSQVQQMLSSVGIRSYYTINRAHDTEFHNGTYTTRQSYDLNVTKDRHLFRSLIGFIHTYKQRRLNWICDNVIVSGRSKDSYEITDVEYLGKFPVYDITVDDPEHVYWCGGLKVSNCSEYMFLNWTSCNLATLNLMKFSSDQSQPYGCFDQTKFRQAVRVLTLAQDILLDFAESPTEKIATESYKYRTIGLNYANLAAYLMHYATPYDSLDARRFASHVTSLLTAFAYEMSADIAKEMGPFERYRDNAGHMQNVLELHKQQAVALARETVDAWNVTLDKVDRYGARNAQVSLAAPTGTVSFMLGCDTTGVEPTIALSAIKKLSGGGTLSLTNNQVEPALKRLGYDTDSLMPLLASGDIDGFMEQLDQLDREVFACAIPQGSLTPVIDPKAHINMVAAIQPFLSGGVSKTINVPNSTTVEEIMDLYLLAWKLQLKSVAIYRDGSKQAQPLNAVRPTTQQRLTTNVSPYRKRLPDERNALTHKFSVGGLKGYAIVGTYEDGTPGEVFLSVSKQGSTLSGMTDAFATLLSIALQYGVPLDDLVRKFSYTRFEPMGYTSNPDLRMATSIIDYLFRWMEQKFLGGRSAATAVLQTETLPPEGIRVFDAPMCMNCGGETIRSGSCFTCTVCFTTNGCA